MEHVKDPPIDYYCIEKQSGSRVVCHVIPAEGFDVKQEPYIVQCIQNQVGSDIDVSVDFVQERILSKSGKVAYVLDGTK